VDVPAAALREQFIPALAELFPGRARRAGQPSSSSPVSGARRSARRPGRPGSARGRPRTCRAWSWPARDARTDGQDTMESAVRSGLAAAIELRRTVLAGPDIPYPDIPYPDYPVSWTSVSGHPVSGIPYPDIPYPDIPHPDIPHPEIPHPDILDLVIPTPGYSESVLSGSEANVPTSTIGERQWTAVMPEGVAPGAGPGEPGDRGGHRPADAGRPRGRGVPLRLRRRRGQPDRGRQRQGAAARPGPAVRACHRRSARARRDRPRSRWNWCTTGPCCTTTSWTATPSAGTGRPPGPCSASARPSWPATRCWPWPRTCCSRTAPRRVPGRPAACPPRCSG